MHVTRPCLSTVTARCLPGHEDLSQVYIVDAADLLNNERQLSHHIQSYIYHSFLHHDHYLDPSLTQPTINPSAQLYATLSFAYNSTHSPCSRDTTLTSLGQWALSPSLFAAQFGIVFVQHLCTYVPHIMPLRHISTKVLHEDNAELCCEQRW